MCDDGQPRNPHVTAAHGFFSRDGTAPSELPVAATARRAEVIVIGGGQAGMAAG